MREATQEEREGVEMYIGSIADIAPSKWMAENLCDDCISRQEAIDAIWDGVNMDIYTREVKECLEKLPSVTPAEKVGQWIPVGERLPKDDTEVLITYIYSGHEIVNVAWINNREWYYRNDILLSDVKVIAWMPLPEPMRLENK